MRLSGMPGPQAPLVFLLLTAGALFATGNLRLGPAGDRDGHDHGAGAEAGQDGHDREEEAACGEGSCGGDEARASARCEHGLATVDCDDCRFELGVVRVDPEVGEALLGRGSVERRSLPLELALTGRVAPDRSRVVAVPAPVSGRILEARVDLGRELRAGDPMFVLHSGEIARARADLLDARTRAEVAERERSRQVRIAESLAALLTALPAEIDRPLGGAGAEEPGTIPDAPAGEWKSRLVTAAAELRAARARHARELALSEKGISSRAEHEEAHRAWEAARAGYAALVEEVLLTADVDRLRAGNEALRARAAVRAAEQRLSVYGLGESELGSPPGGGGEDFALLVIRAPRAGTVTSLTASAGLMAKEGLALATVTDQSRLWVWCDLYERDLGPVQSAQASGGAVRARVRVAAFPGEVFEGALDLLGSEVDEGTRTLRARVVVDNPGGLLRPGMFARVTLSLPGAEVGLVVPRSAVLEDAGRAFVFVHFRDDLWVRRDVSVLGEAGEFVAVEGDLAEGATVATEGAFMLKGDVLREKMGAG